MNKTWWVGAALVVALVAGCDEGGGDTVEGMDPAQLAQQSFELDTGVPSQDLRIECFGGECCLIYSGGTLCGCCFPDEGGGFCDCW